MADNENVALFRLSAARAQDTIRETAKDDNKITWGTHALERMEERGIYDFDVLRILRSGWVEEDPEPTARGEWKCKMTMEIKRRRIAGVLTVIMLNGELFVKTVEWEDSM